jgi:hypothetical protein
VRERLLGNTQRTSRHFPNLTPGRSPSMNSTPAFSSAACKASMSARLAAPARLEIPDGRDRHDRDVREPRLAHIDERPRGAALGGVITVAAGSG